MPSRMCSPSPRTKLQLYPILGLCKVHPLRGCSIAGDYVMCAAMRASKRSNKHNLG